MGDKRGAESPPPVGKDQGKKPKRNITFNSTVQTVKFDSSSAIHASAPAPERLKKGEKSEDKEPSAESKLGKHSLDSDEEDIDEDAAAQYTMTDEDLHEDLDQGFNDGGAQLTAFNLDEELHEGHFDENGNYIRDKKTEEKDAWLDSVDQQETTVYVPKYVKKAAVSDEPHVPLNRRATMERILSLVEPEETVAKALRRYGGMGQQGSKWGKHKPQASSGDPAKLKELTELSDSLIANGYMDIYTDTHEKLAYDLKTNANPGASQIKPTVEYEESDDEEDDKKFKTRKERADASDQDAVLHAEEATTAVPATELDPSVTYFEYKWEDKEDAPLYGPFPAQHMLGWSEQGLFGDGVLCRVVNKGPGAPFYNSKRVDFDLYT